MKKRLFAYIFIVVLFSVFSFILGSMIGDKGISVSDSEIFLETEKYSFRDGEGHRINVLETKEGVLYIPVEDSSLFFDYSVEKIEDGLMLSRTNYDQFVDINTKTFEGIPFTNEDIYANEYTLLLNWATWCPDCKDLFSDLVDKVDELESQNIKLVGLPIYSGDFEKEKEKVDKILSEYNLDFDNLICTDSMKEELQSNIANIPSVILLDNRGKILYDNDNVNLLISDFLEDLENIEKCDEC